MGEQLLYIPESALTNMITIGEGIPSNWLAQYHNCLTLILPYTGQFGRVYKAWLHTGSGATTEVAVKTIRKYDPREMKNFMREMAVMSQLMHPNVIHLHGVVKESMTHHHDHV